MLKRIRVQGFKSLRDVEVEFAPLVVLFGPNAVGKSNLLEAILLMARVATTQTIGAALEASVRGYPLEAFSLPRGGMAALLSQNCARSMIEADVEPVTDNPRREALRYRVEIEAAVAAGEFTVVDEYLAKLKRDGTPKTKPRIERVDEHLVVRRLGEAGQPRQEALRLNHTQLSNLQFSGRTRYPDFDRLREEFSSWRSYYLDPAKSMRAPQPPKETSDIGTAGELIAPYLYRLKGNSKYSRHFDAVTRALRTAVPSIDRLDVALDKERGTLDVRICQRGSEYSSRVISEGTLRVLALCAIAANPWPSGLVAFEEPENGVHPRRIEVIAKLLMGLALKGQPQVIVTTHSPAFVAEMLKLSEKEKKAVKVMRCIEEQGSTRIVGFDVSGPLFEKLEVSEALANDDNGFDDSLIYKWMIRGWMDG